MATMGSGSCARMQNRPGLLPSLARRRGGAGAARGGPLAAGRRRHLLPEEAGDGERRLLRRREVAQVVGAPGVVQVRLERLAGASSAMNGLLMMLLWLTPLKPVVLSARTSTSPSAAAAACASAGVIAARAGHSGVAVGRIGRKYL